MTYPKTPIIHERVDIHLELSLPSPQLTMTTHMSPAMSLKRKPPTSPLQEDPPKWANNSHINAQTPYVSSIVSSLVVCSKFNFSKTRYMPTISQAQ
jgi:hypothetical protein